MSLLPATDFDTLPSVRPSIRPSASQPACVSMLGLCSLAPPGGPVALLSLQLSYVLFMLSVERPALPLAVPGGGQSAAVPACAAGLGSGPPLRPQLESVAWWVQGHRPQSSYPLHFAPRVSVALNKCSGSHQAGAHFRHVPEVIHYSKISGDLVNRFR